MKDSILNKGISTPVGIFVIVLAAIIAGTGILFFYKSAECYSPVDCECRPHIMCVGEWKCIDHKCVWSCEIGKTIEDETADWEIYKNEEYGYEFKYPKEFTEEFNLKYIIEWEWPPFITIRPFDPDFVCKNLSSVKTEMGYGNQKEVVVNNRKYCILVVGEGVAGSIYKTYSYINTKDNKHLNLAFVLRFTNCGNFDENIIRECQEEQDEFEPTVLIDEVFSTFRFLE